MQSYNILKNVDQLPDELMKKPRCSSCMIFSATFVAIALLTVVVGVCLGYTYCYLAFKKDNFRHRKDFQIYRINFTKNNDPKTKINEAISSVLLSRILAIGNALIESDISFFHRSDDGKKIDNVKSGL